MPKARKYEAIFCPHCDRNVSKSTWYAHHRDFFDKASGIWKKVIIQQRKNFSFAEEEEDGSSSDEACNETGCCSSLEDANDVSSVHESYRHYQHDINTIFKNFWLGYCSSYLKGPAWVRSTYKGANSRCVTCLLTLYRMKLDRRTKIQLVLLSQLLNIGSRAVTRMLQCFKMRKTFLILK